MLNMPKTKQVIYKSSQLLFLYYKLEKYSVTPKEADSSLTF